MPNNYDMEALTPISCLLKPSEIFPNDGSGFCFQETELSHELLNKREHFAEDYKSTCRAVNTLEHSALNTSLSINEILSEGEGNDSMCDETIRSHQQDDHSDSEDVIPGLNTSSKCHEPNSQNEFTTTPHFMPSYIMGSSNGNYIYNGSVSSYVCGDSMYDEQGKWNSKSTKLSNYIVQMPIDGHVSSCAIAPPTEQIENCKKGLLVKQDIGSPETQQQMIVVVVCPNCHSTECFPHTKTETINTEFPTAFSISEPRRGSLSDHSVDSGYSPDVIDSTVV